MSAIIEHQLKRAAASGGALLGQAPVEVGPIVSELRVTLLKVYARKDLSIELKKTTDILKTLGEQKQNGQILVGFALETNDEEKNAIDKLQRKNLDFIVLNSLNDEGAGFKTDTNKITIIDNRLQKTTFELKDKNEVAKDICNKVAELIKA